ncbi:Mating-type protein MAT-1 [Abeliophyllum distichum]|uniref:Mating-type protein MAT-1 n=1 Tax=Abeliophyllum distichum TaxID=126358 RepID=A0ABD1TJI9_9LAMI
MSSRKSSDERNPLSSFFTEDEIQVGEILLDLQSLIGVSGLQPRMYWSWGCKRKRSSTVNAGEASSSSRSVLNENEEGRLQIESPNTPLSFWNTESDEKICKKRTRKENNMETITRREKFHCPDLNIPAQETFGLYSSQPLDINRVIAFADKRTRFAEARRMRREIMKAKLMKKSLNRSRQLFLGNNFAS